MGERTILARAVLFAVFGVACRLDASFDGTAYRCDVSGACPSGFDCIAGVCVRDGVDAGVDDGAVTDASTNYTPVSHCGGPSLLAADFEAGEPEWGTRSETNGTLMFSDGRARAVMNPSTADARVAFRSRQVYALKGAMPGAAGDGLEVEVVSLSGPGAAGLALRRTEGALEISVTETELRCDRTLAGGVVERISSPREGATRLRVTARDGRLYCEARSESADLWRAVGDYAGFGEGYAEVELFGVGLAGTAPTSVTFDNLNPGRAAAGWCKPGAFLDDFSSAPTAAKWSLTMASCDLGATNGVASVERGQGGTFACHATHRHLVDLSATGRIGFEIASVTGAGISVVGLGSPANGIDLSIRDNKLQVMRCVDASCAKVAEVAYQTSMRYVGFDARAAGIVGIWSSDQLTWNAMGAEASAPFARAATPVFFGIRGNGIMGATKLSLDRLFSTP